jgi:hypothetical protein
MNEVGTDLIPDPTTAGDFCRRFAEADVAASMDAVNAVRPKLWRGRGRHLGLRAADRHVGQHPGGALSDQPARQRPQPP